MSTYDGAYSDGRMKTIYPEQKKKEPKEMTEAERIQYEKEYQAMKDFDFAGMYS